MIRTIVFAAALAFVAAGSFATTADAGFKHKLCKASTLDGKPVTFTCKASEKCCYNKLLNEKKCGSKDGILGLGSNMLCL